MSAGPGAHGDPTGPEGPVTVPLTSRAERWAATMSGHASQIAGIRQPHAGPAVALPAVPVVDREARERAEKELLAPGATLSSGAGQRPAEEEPDPWRTCFERDRDRILHAAAFRRLAGKTQVFIFPDDHQRTRLTHALEVAQIARSIAAALGLNGPLTEAIALGHDAGHGPFGHASEDALDPLVPGGFDHAPWGADVTLAPLNLTNEVRDGIRNHSWSRPAATTPEGEVCAIADRLAYATHDAEDAARAGIVDLGDLPPIVKERVGVRRSAQLRAFVTDVVDSGARFGAVGMSPDLAEALAALRSWNYERIYLRPESVAQSGMVVRLLGALVEHFSDHPEAMTGGQGFQVDHTTGGTEADRRAAVAYVAGMTDRFACLRAAAVLGWPSSEMPRGLDLPAA